MRINTALSLAIFAMAAPTLAQTPAQDQRSLVRENFKLADANGDDRLSRPEFRRFIDENAKDKLGRSAMVKQFGAYDTAFERVDSNKDGFVTKGEIAQNQQK